MTSLARRSAFPKAWPLRCERLEDRSVPATLNFVPLLAPDLLTAVPIEEQPGHDAPGVTLTGPSALPPEAILRECEDGCERWVDDGGAVKPVLDENGCVTGFWWVDNPIFDGQDPRYPPQSIVNIIEEEDLARSGIPYVSEVPVQTVPVHRVEIGLGNYISDRTCGDTDAGGLDGWTDESWVDKGWVDETWVENISCDDVCGEWMATGVAKNVILDENGNVISWESDVRFPACELPGVAKIGEIASCGEVYATGVAKNVILDEDGNVISWESDVRFPACKLPGVAKIGELPTGDTGVATGDVPVFELPTSESEGDGGWVVTIIPVTDEITTDETVLDTLKSAAGITAEAVPSALPSSPAIETAGPFAGIALPPEYDADQLVAPPATDTLDTPANSVSLIDSSDSIDFTSVDEQAVPVMEFAIRTEVDEPVSPDSLELTADRALT